MGDSRRHSGGKGSFRAAGDFQKLALAEEKPNRSAHATRSDTQLVRTGRNLQGVGEGSPCQGDRRMCFRLLSLSSASRPTRGTKGRRLGLCMLQPDTFRSRRWRGCRARSSRARVGQPARALAPLPALLHTTLLALDCLVAIHVPLLRLGSINSLPNGSRNLCPAAP
jgi:hypothetical protein